MLKMPVDRLRILFVVAGLVLVACSSDTDSNAPTAAPTATSSGAGRAPAADGAEAGREVVAESLAYAEVDDSVVYGHFAIPVDMIDPLPAVLVIHDWWGLNDAMRETCERLAAQGYIVLGVDMFGGQTAASAPQARQLEIAVIEQPELVLDNLQQAMDFVLDVANAPDIAVLGYGFGGSWALNAAVDRGDRLSAAALFYGQVNSEKGWLAQLAVPVLGFFAENDRAVTASTVAGFESALQELGKAHDIVMYPDARRGFADVQSDNYDAALANQSWEQLLDFLAATLKQTTN